MATHATALPLPRRLQQPVAAVHTLEDDKAERLLLSRRRGEQACRQSLSALYTLATQLRSPQLPYHAKQLVTAASEAVTLEQIWGQMSVLLRPVLRRLQDQVRQVQRAVAATPSTSSSSTSRSKKQTRQQAAAADDAKNKHKSDNNNDDDDSSSTDESELDAEIATLLAQRRQQRHGRAGATTAGADASASTTKAKKGGGSGDDWRYAFGKSSGGDVADDDSWGDAADKNADDDDDNNDDDEGGDGDADEELQALRMMYGDDYADDGHGLAGDDPDLADDIELDDPANDKDNDDDDDGHHAAERNDNNDDVGGGGYRPRDGQYYGNDDILRDDNDDDGGNNEDSKAGDDDEADDAELAAALRDPNLTPLERERLRERHHVARLEQARLYHTNWAMAGETAASKRPREALLEATELEYEYGMKSVPVITEASTAALEERIKQRILAGNYDDVVRRVAATTPDDLHASLHRRAAAAAAADAEKSKLSLMDLYEKEYTERVRAAEEAAAAGHESSGSATAAEPLTEVEKDELRAIQLWRRLAQHLDALSNFFYTPKPVQHELEARVRAVDRQAPAIALESVGHAAATSREDALAPQDLYRGSSHKLAGVGAAELTPRERHALRRAKKQSSRQHTHAINVAKQRKQQQQQQQQQQQATTTTRGKRGTA